MKTEMDEPSYLERTAHEFQITDSERLKSLLSLYDKYHTACKTVSGGTVIGMNTARETGLQLQAWCGHEVMKVSFWKGHCEGKLPYDFLTAKFFMSVARRMQREAKSVKEVAEFMQLMLISDGQIEVPHRLEAQAPATVSPAQKWFNDFTGMRLLLDKVKRDEPMEKWHPNRLEKFLAETEWLAHDRERAENLLSKT